MRSSLADGKATLCPCGGMSRKKFVKCRRKPQTAPFDGYRCHKDGAMYQKWSNTVKQTVFIPFIASLAFVIAVGSATAQDANKRAPFDFEELDANADGQLTPEEMAGAKAMRFDRADADGDGFLTLAELEAQAAEQAKRRAERMMTRMDANKDGKVSQEEIEGAREGGRFFHRADTDGDGAVSKAEFEAAAASMRKHRS